jgi:hypothetical protein
MIKSGHAIDFTRPVGHAPRENGKPSFRQIMARNWQLRESDPH